MATAIAAQAQPPNFATPSSPKTTYTSQHHHLRPALVSQASVEEHHHQAHYRPAKNLEAFISLLPPAVEFVEGSSTGALAVAEGKYEPINASPKAADRPVVEANGKAKVAPPPSPTKSRSRDSRQEQRSLFNGQLILAWPPNYNIGIGFYNQGNTCFLNSVLQCLLHTPPLMRLLHEHTESEPCPVKSNFCMCCSLRKVMCDSYTRTLPFSPNPISRNLHYIAKHLRNGRQEDSHEFLRYAIDGLQKSCLAGFPPKIDHKLAETTWVHKLFGGRLRSRVTCTQCGHNSDTFDSILDLSIDIHQCGSLKDALRKFTAIDYLKGADKYKCEKCKRPVNAEKQFTIHDAPPVLTVHLKRFSPLGRKLAHPIRYDERLNLQPSMSEGQFGPTYQLYGVISHAGSGPNSGHYYAHIKSGHGHWYEMNDDLVERVKGAPMNMKNAYILFYMQEKGQSLEAALNTSSSSLAPSRSDNWAANVRKTAVNSSVQSSIKKRKVVMSDDEDEGERVEKADPTTTRFIGPQLPPGSQKSSSKSSLETPPSSPTTSRSHPQTEFLKKKIEAAEKKKENKLTKAPPPKIALVDYGDDDDDDMDMSGDRKTKVGRQALSASSTQTTLGESSPPVQPPASSMPSSPLSSAVSSTTTMATVAPSSFYGSLTSASSSKKSSETAKKRKSPDHDIEMSSDTISNSYTRPPLKNLRQESSGGGSSKSTATESMRSSSSTSTPRPFSASNPFERMRGSNNLDSSREESALKPRKLMKKQYGTKKRSLM